MRKLAVVIGASRGIGLALAEAVHRAGYDVVGTCRNLAPELQRLDITIVSGFDIQNSESLELLSKTLGSRKTFLLIVASGIQEPDKFETIAKQSILRQFEINALCPLLAVKHLQPQLQPGAKVILISSRNASITDVEATGNEMVISAQLVVPNLHACSHHFAGNILEHAHVVQYGYRLSKVALNMAGKTLAADLKRLSSATVALIHPGVVNTDMLRALRRGRGVAEEQMTANTLSPEESAARVLKVIDGMTMENSGTYWAADTGKTLPW